jgi:hypothetical protein
LHLVPPAIELNGITGAVVRVSEYGKQYDEDDEDPDEAKAHDDPS